ncbi:hypothetical protein ABZW47_17640 [Streptomyces sp. NPDC004549]|uniref:hypothetical protein n=1 Tax=Streptomyces sp. NPDC004549 TaxID=3154283 RepID=UPI0033A09DF0
MPVRAQSDNARTTAESTTDDLPAPYIGRIEPYELPRHREAGPDRGDGPGGYEPAWYGV